MTTETNRSQHNNFQSGFALW